MALSFNDVRPIAQGQWLNILEGVAPSLTEAVRRFPKHVGCPVHGGKDGFRLYKDADYSGGGICNTCGAFSDGFSLVCWCNGWQLSDALKAVAGFLGIDERLEKPIIQSKIIQPDPKKLEHERLRKRKALQCVRDGIIDLSDEQAGTAVRYLTNRGLADCLSSMPRDLYFHPSLSYWHEGKDYGYHPALVAVVRDIDGKPITLHRTYLTDKGGKANLPARKKLMSPVLSGSTKGAAIQLFPAEKELVLAEGIETALALHLSLKKPCWACISAGGLESIQLPSQVKHVIVGADNDKSGVGQNAAKSLAERLVNDKEGIQVKIITPEHTGMDWLDVFNNEEKAA